MSHRTKLVTKIFTYQFFIYFCITFFLRILLSDIHFLFSLNLLSGNDNKFSSYK